MAITSEMVRELREKTSCGMMECKRALEETQGDMEKASEILRKKGLASAEKKASRVASQGVIESYIHLNSKLGVMIELNCETDFVAKNPDFVSLAKDIAMHAAAMNPQYIAREEVPAEVLEKEKDILREQARAEKKPEKIIEKMVEGRLDKFYAEMCLLEQPFVKAPEKKIIDLVKENIAKFGENIVVRRFTRYQIG